MFPYITKQKSKISQFVVISPCRELGSTLALRAVSPRRVGTVKTRLQPENARMGPGRAAGVKQIVLNTYIFSLVKVGSKEKGKQSY